MPGEKSGELAASKKPHSFAGDFFGAGGATDAEAALAWFTDIEHINRAWLAR